MSAMTTFLAPFDGFLAESAGIENDLRTLGQRAIRTSAQLVLEASAGLAGSAVGQAAVNQFVVASPTSPEIVEQAFTLLVGRFVRQRAVAAKQRLAHIEKFLGGNAATSLIDKWEQLAERAENAHPTSLEALNLLQQRALLLAEERALIKGHPELERSAEAEPSLGAEFVDVPLVLSHLEPVVPGRSYLGTRAQIDAGIDALHAVGLPPRELVTEIPGLHRFEIRGRTLELRERAEASNIEHTKHDARAEERPVPAIVGQEIAARVPGVTYNSGGTFRVSTSRGTIDAEVRRTTQSSRVLRDGKQVTMEIPRGLQGTDLERAIIAKLNAIRMMIDDGRVRIHSERGITQGKITFEEFGEKTITTDEKANAREKTNIDNTSTLDEQARQVKVGNPRNEREVIAAIFNNDIPRYIARVDAESSYIKYESFGRSDRQFIYATEPADLRGLGPAAALEKVGWTKEWIKKLVGSEIAVCIFDTKSAIPTDAGNRAVSVDSMAWEHLIEKTLNDEKFLARAINEFGVSDKAELARILHILERTPVLADPLTHVSTLENKAAAVRVLLNTWYSTNDLFTGFGATMNGSGNLGVRELMVENNNTGFKLTAENHILVRLGTLKIEDVDAGEPSHDQSN